MSRILQSHPKSVQCHKDLILQCLDDKDESIRLRALDLLYGMVRNLIKLVCINIHEWKSTIQKIASFCLVHNSFIIYSGMLDTKNK